MGSWAVQITDFLGYTGICFLMALESMVVPLPSELVMPFAGFLVHQGRFSFTGALIAATLGSLIGSLISYAMGYYGGEIFVKKIGRYLLLDEKDLEWSEKWFAKRGEATIFFARFVPVVRHLISIPAGLAKTCTTAPSPSPIFAKAEVTELKGSTGNSRNDLIGKYDDRFNTNCTNATLPASEKMLYSSTAFTSAPG